MSDTTPNDGKTTPDTDAPPTPPTGATDRAAVPVTDAADSPHDTRSPEAIEHDAAVAAATERANSGALAGEYTDAEVPGSDVPTTAVRVDDAPDPAAHAPDPADAPYVPGAAYGASAGTTAAPSSAALAADYAAPPVVATPPSASEPAAPVTQTPIYVQAPTPPKDRGNRGAGVLIALLATLV